LGVAPPENRRSRLAGPLHLRLHLSWPSGIAGP